MTDEVLLQRGTTLVRRLRLAPGEAMPWHRDPFHRVTVILAGNALAIEYRDSADRHDVEPVEALGWSLAYAWVMLLRVSPFSLLLGILVGVGMAYTQQARTR